MKNRKLMSKRELFIRRILALIFTITIIIIFHLKTQRVVSVLWMEIIIVLAVLLPLIKDIKQKNWRSDNK